MKKIIIIILAATLFTLVLTGCDGIRPTDEIVSIALADNVFKNEYSLDEELDPTKLFVTALHKSGQQIRTKITIDDIEGFDTSTTGEKELRIKYEGKSTSYHTYTVTYFENPALSITVSTRLSMARANQSSQGAKYSVFYNTGGLDGIKAIWFSVVTEQNTGFGIIPPDLNLDFAVKVNGFSAKALYADPKRFDVFLFLDDADATLAGSGALLDITIFDADIAEYALTNIKVSDGLGTYVLPNARI